MTISTDFSKERVRFYFFFTRASRSKHTKSKKELDKIVDSVSQNIVTTIGNTFMDSTILYTFDHSEFGEIGKEFRVIHFDSRFEIRKVYNPFKMGGDFTKIAIKSGQTDFVKGKLFLKIVIDYQKCYVDVDSIRDILDEVVKVHLGIKEKPQNKATNSNSGTKDYTNSFRKFMSYGNIDLD